jgi:apolipoprotein N-acyltransferase
LTVRKATRSSRDGSATVPWILGILLAINGLGWMLNSLGPYVLPKANLGFTFVTFFGELFFMLWLLIRGWKIRPLGREATQSTA